MPEDRELPDLREMPETPENPARTEKTEPMGHPERMARRDLATTAHHPEPLPGIRCINTNRINSPTVLIVFHVCLERVMIT